MKARAWLVTLALLCVAAVSVTLRTGVSRAASSYQGLVVIPSYDSSTCLGYLFETYAGVGVSCRTLPGGPTSLGVKSAVAADGTIVFAGQTQGPDPVIVSRPDGSFVTADASSRDFDPAVAPDGSKIAFARYVSADPYQGSDLYTVNPDGSDLTLVAAGNGSLLSSPAFSPDGSAIAYSCSSAGGAVLSHCGPLPDGRFLESGLMLMKTDGSGKRMILAGEGGPFPAVGEFQSLSWSPDGQTIATAGIVECSTCTPAAGGINDQVFVYRTDGSDLFNMDVPSLAITHEKDDFGGSFPQFTADGSQILYLKFLDDNLIGGNYSYVVNLNGTGRKELFFIPDPECRPDNVCAPDWGVVVPPPTGGGPGPLVNAMRVMVPGVHGLSYAQARKRLVLAHLRIGTVGRQYNSRIPAGRIIRQSPAAGSIVHRTHWTGPPVSLVLSRGPQY